MQIDEYTFINAHIHQGQLIDSTPYRARRILLTDFYNSGHPDWKTHVMGSQSKRQLHDDVLWLEYENIVAQRLSFSPLTNWISYQLATDMSQGFGIDYFFTPRAMSHQITSVNILSHRRTMPDASDHTPVHININQNY